LFGWIILREGLTPIQLTGCVLMFLAVVLAQISFQPKAAVN